MSVILRKPRGLRSESIFYPRPLKKEEEESIKKILKLYRKHPSSLFDEVDVNERKILEITKKIKDAGPREHLRMGELLNYAKKIFKNYKNGAFGKWCLIVFSNMRTTASLINYYNFYKKIKSEDIKDKFKKISIAGAYQIASRKIPYHEKEVIIMNCPYDTHINVQRYLSNEFKKVEEKNKPTEKLEKSPEENNPEIKTTTQKIIEIMESLKELALDLKK